jgi:hypothetical protein
VSGSIETRIRQASDAVAGLNKGGTFENWTEIGEGLALREEAMQKAGVTTPYGPAYKRELAAIQAREKAWVEDPRLAHPTNSNAIWMVQNLAIIQAWRASLPPDQALAYNHPGSVRREFSRAQRGLGLGGGGGRRGGGTGQWAAPQGNKYNKAAFEALMNDYLVAQQRILDLEALLAAKDSPDGYAEFPFLGLDTPFTERQVNDAYRQAAKAYHADAGGSDEQMQRLNKERDAALKKATRSSGKGVSSV